MEMLNQKQKIMAVIIIIIVAGVIVYYYIDSTKSIYNYNEIENEIVEINEVEIETEEVNETIFVHITGAVIYSGVVEVDVGARINDVIDEAGGITADADLTNVNLAYKVEDGQKIYIPSIYDKEETEDLEIIINEAGDNIIENYIETEESGLININEASANELEELPGIGSSTANKIITYREENGKFTEIEDIKNVSGIGDAKYEAIKDYICV